MMIVAIGNDGIRPVVWGLGETREEAETDARRWIEGVGLLADYECLPEFARAAGLPLFEDTRQRFSSPAGLDAAWALYRFARC